MKALSLTQPWATLVAIGAKQIETRSWSTSYRGEVAIHAAKGFPKDAKALCNTLPFQVALAPYVQHVDELPRGMVVATCKLIDVVRISHTKELFAYTPIAPAQDSRELAFGDYSIGRYMWILSDIKPLATPVPAKGALGLWEWNTTDVFADSRVKIVARRNS